MNTSGVCAQQIGCCITVGRSSMLSTVVLEYWATDPYAVRFSFRNGRQWRISRDYLTSALFFGTIGMFDVRVSNQGPVLEIQQRRDDIGWGSVSVNIQSMADFLAATRSVVDDGEEDFCPRDLSGVMT